MLNAMMIVYLCDKCSVNIEPRCRRRDGVFAADLLFLVVLVFFAKFHVNALLTTTTLRSLAP
jgi:hypothetical protein